MNFADFTDYIKQNINKGWMTDASVTVQKVKKNNGVTHTSLTILPAGRQAAPTIYLEDYYEKHQGGQSLLEIIEEIRAEYDLAMSRVAVFDYDITSFSGVRDKIIYRLVSFDRNKETLDHCPHIRMDDLAVTFRWLAHEDNIGISTALISSRELEMWGVGLEQILLAARENTPRIFPASVMPLDQMLFDDQPELAAEWEHIPMYVVTNRQQINGAAVILYDHFLEDFVSDHPGNYYILPSSIHEMILVPADSVDDPKGLKGIVAHANATVVPEGDYLSDSVYYYDAERNIISLYNP